MSLPPLPPQLKAIQHYLKTATEHDKRDPVVAYYCRLYALQNGMEIDKKSPECRTFHVALMDYLERVKKENDSESIHNEVVGQAHMENYALKVFLFADNEDRAARFNKNVVKSFYTAGMLFDTLSVFGEMSEDIDKNRKYAKWKAAYIHKCLKNGETPIPGPQNEEGEEGDTAQGGAPIGFEQPDPSQGYSPAPGPSSYQPGPSTYQPGPSASDSLNLPGNDPSPNGAQPGTHAPPSTPQDPQNSTKPAPQQVSFNTDWKPPANTNGVDLNTQHYQKAMKYCKYASSALQYEDSKTAIDNLTKALTLLTTGKDS
ncbi:vacuolar protein sorting-associated protein VTA1 homolog [Mercenaria mercenaria]|uniref:vacuolar protein sorting-associated protein VTA1 homolog n=1 Tax=Mercenaria mercenaria TaxID=6596 RepID=UPI00234EAB24|nr:vacuolar protein sorting-associated protein VTA1 homolog [Mercenaria mercenaria]